MIFVVRCDTCGEPSHCYSVALPRPNRKRCDKCGHSHESITKTFHFCSWGHLQDFVYNTDPSLLFTTKDDKDET